MHKTQTVNLKADGASLPTIPLHHFLFTQCSCEQKGDQVAILGHHNVLYSAICSSNCRPSGIFDIFCIETQQLQLAWHAVGVFKGGVVAKRVSENNLPLRATHTHLYLETYSCLFCTYEHTGYNVVHKYVLFTTRQSTSGIWSSQILLRTSTHRCILDLSDLERSQLP